MVWIYGSGSEDLKSIEPYDHGDQDIMIWPNSDSLMIHVELLRYSLENPLHVRIQGSDHPVLQSCLVEGTKDVSTSALRNFHPTIFGCAVPTWFDMIMKVLKEFPSIFATSLKNNACGPAVTLNIFSALGENKISKQATESESVGASNSEEIKNGKSKTEQTTISAKRRDPEDGHWLQKNGSNESVNGLPVTLWTGYSGWFPLGSKPPKNSSNSDRDFRISFSHAEYLLSQEMNDIQRECYRCLKKFHRAHLSTQPKSLVSFHLKNILLQTIEETRCRAVDRRQQSRVHNENSSPTF
ncbi:hypothetical protein OS493_025649 [Desmophyllum pertusum]|uniref:Uncharacterized protein n=1 Tax=Desmophyllum pertusum TaxID=174260 RepID=A0A9W9ZZK4_9CNID|nr:hypothetical protein OS493_025649 [Desmophyllum pertusum]